MSFDVSPSTPLYAHDIRIQRVLAFHELLRRIGIPSESILVGVNQEVRIHYGCVAWGLGAITDEEGDAFMAAYLVACDRWNAPSTPVEEYDAVFLPFIANVNMRVIHESLEKARAEVVS